MVLGGKQEKSVPCRAVSSHGLRESVVGPLGEYSGQVFRKGQALGTRLDVCSFFSIPKGRHICPRHFFSSRRMWAFLYLGSYLQEHQEGPWRGSKRGLFCASQSHQPRISTRKNLLEDGHELLLKLGKVSTTQEPRP